LADDVERILADIDADHGDLAVECLGHGMLLCLRCSCQFGSLAGLEHGRTIPFADIGKEPRLICLNADREQFTYHYS
jgi:hypothetical protein